MQNIFIGECIRQRRKELNLTQEQVCDGICDLVSLSRIENGKQTPRRSIINALLQRLGLPDDHYYALVSENELEMEALKKEILACNALSRIAEGFEKIQMLDKLCEPEDQLTQQFILRSKVLLGSINGCYTFQEQIDLLIRAIRLTIPNFDLEELDQYLYTFDEIKIIIHIANSYSLDNQNEKAADIFSQLLKYIKKHAMETIASGGLLPLILYNYARALDLCERYKEASKYALQGQKACIDTGHYQSLPSCLEIYAECCHFLGCDAESAEAYTQAYHLCKVIGLQDDLEIVKTEAKKYLNLTF